MLFTTSYFLGVFLGLGLGVVGVLGVLGVMGLGVADLGVAVLGLALALLGLALFGLALALLDVEAPLSFLDAATIAQISKAIKTTAPTAMPIMAPVDNLLLPLASADTSTVMDLLTGSPPTTAEAVKRAFVFAFFARLLAAVITPEVLSTVKTDGSELDQVIMVGDDVFIEGFVTSTLVLMSLYTSPSLRLKDAGVMVMEPGVL